MANDPIIAAIDAADDRLAHDDPELTRRLAGELKNDLGNARRLEKRFGPDMLWSDDHGWHIWDGRRWRVEGGEAEATKRAHLTAELVFAEAEALRDNPPDKMELVQRFQTKGRAPSDADKLAQEIVDGHLKRIEKLFSFASSSGNGGKLKAMLEHARPYLRRRRDEIDAAKRLLTVENGTLVLDETVRLKAHDRKDVLTRLAPVTYDKDATAPQWQKFLDQILPDKDVQLFVQRFLGYALTGETGEQCILVFYGAGANGKSTLLDTVGHILGDIAVVSPVATFLTEDRRAGGQPSPDLARLDGARLVFASEPEPGSTISESRIKSVTSSERIIARGLYAPFFEFTPHFKLIFSCNARPKVKGLDAGTWRRLRLVPFTVQIPQRLRDMRMSEKLREEASGILNWLIDGLRMWIEEGLNPPPAVVAATEEYRLENDPIGQFAAQHIERVDPSEGAFWGSTTLYAEYKIWAERQGMKPWTQNAVGRRLHDLGFESEKVGTKRWINIRIRSGESSS